MAKKNVEIINRNKEKTSSVPDKQENLKYQNEKLRVNNQNPDNKGLKNTGEDIKKEIESNESPVIPEQQITNIKTYGTKTDKLVVELVGKYRNIWNYLTKPDVIRRIKENSKDIEVIPIEYSFMESKEIEFLFSQIKEIYLDGISIEVSMENLNKFSDRHGEILSEVLLELISSNVEQIKKYQAGIQIIYMLGRV